MRSRPCARGFTLLELLVAAAITAVLVGMIVLVVANVSRFWTRSSSRLAAAAQSRFILDQLALDLQSAVYRDDGNVWLAADILTDTTNSGLWERAARGTEKPPYAAGTKLRADASQIAEASFGQAGVWLRFFTVKRGRNTTLETSSTPVAVGWQIVRRAGSSARTAEARYFLHRAEISPERTLLSGFDITAAPYAVASPAPVPGKSHAVRSPPVQSIIGENVIDFGVRLHAHRPNETETLLFPQGSQTSHRATNPPGVDPPETQFPQVVDVMVRVLTDEGARLISGFEADEPRVFRPANVSDDAEYWWTIALAHSQVFTRRIVIERGAP